jgi:hypothetical protein
MPQGEVRDREQQRAEDGQPLMIPAPGRAADGMPGRNADGETLGQTLRATERRDREQAALARDADGPHNQRHRLGVDVVGFGAILKKREHERPRGIDEVGLGADGVITSTIALPATISRITAMRNSKNRRPLNGSRASGASTSGTGAGACAWPFGCGWVSSRVRASSWASPRSIFARSAASSPSAGIAPTLVALGCRRFRSHVASSVRVMISQTPVQGNRSD